MHSKAFLFKGLRAIIFCTTKVLGKANFFLAWQTKIAINEKSDNRIITLYNTCAINVLMMELALRWTSASRQSMMEK